MFQFDNLRTKDGVLLRYEVYKKTLFITNKLFKFIDKDILYFTNSKIINYQVISSILRKEVFGEFSSSNIYTLAAYLINKKYKKKFVKKKKIKIDYFSYNLLLKVNFLDLNSISIKYKSFLKFKVLKFTNYFLRFKKRKIYYYCFNNNNKKKIAVKYQVGLVNVINDLFFLTKRSDLNNIVIYFETKADLKRFLSNREDLQYLKNNSIKNSNNIKDEIKCFQIDANLDSNKINLVKNFKSNGIIQDYIKQKIIEYFIEVNFWYSFLKKLNIKIIHNFTIEGTSNIYIYYAISKLNGFSSSYLRSYPRGEKYLNYHWHYHHIIFVIGKDSKNKLLNTYNKFDAIVSLGSFVKLYNKKSYNKKKLLILDSNHDSNTNQNQVILTNDFINFLKRFISFSSSNNIDLFLRTKKKSLIKDLDIVNNKNLSILYNGSSDNKLNLKFDYVVSISTFFPGVILDYLSNDIPCFVYDYGGFSKINYQSQFKNFIFTNLNILFEQLNKQINLKNNVLGTNKIKNHFIYPADDLKGKHIISDYFNFFLKSNKNDFKKDISFTNKKIQYKWNKKIVLNFNK